MKGHDFFPKIVSCHEGTTNYDGEEKDSCLLSTINETIKLLYKLVDEDFRKSRRLHDVQEFLTTKNLLDKVFMPSGAHHDSLLMFSEVFDRLSDGEIFSVM